MQRTLCPKCHGQRTTSCVACRGTGKNSIVGITIGNCKACGGTGRCRCDFCGGGGEVEPSSSISTGKDSPCFTTTSKMMSKTWSVEEHDACYIVKDRSWPTRVALRITASREVANASRVLPLIPTRRFLISVQPLDPSTFEWLSATTWVY